MQNRKNKIFSVDEKITSGNVDELNEKFERSLDMYFDERGNLLPEVAENVNCPSCGGQGGNYFIQKRFKYARCKTCGMVYASPRFTEAINNEIHSQDRYVEHFKCKVIPSIDYRRNVLAKISITK